jgi:hypothetical protein
MAALSEATWEKVRAVFPPAQQVISRAIGPGPPYTAVQVRSRWQIWPKAVLASEGAPEEIETRWLTDSELVIRYAAGYPSDPNFPIPCDPHFETVKITCEPIAGYTLHPDPTSSRGQQLRAAIDRSYRELSRTKATAGNAVQITGVVPSTSNKTSFSRATCGKSQHISEG